MTCSATGLYQHLARLHDQIAHIDEANAREFDRQCEAAESEQVTVRTRKAETGSTTLQVDKATPTPSALASNITSSFCKFKNNFGPKQPPPPGMDRESGKKPLVRKEQRNLTQAHLF